MSFEVPRVIVKEFVSDSGGVRGLVEVNTMKPFVSVTKVFPSNLDWKFRRRRHSSTFRYQFVASNNSFAVVCTYGTTCVTSLRSELLCVICVIMHR